MIRPDGLSSKTAPSSTQPSSLPLREGKAPTSKRESGRSEGGLQNSQSKNEREDWRDEKGQGSGSETSEDVLSWPTET